VADVPSGLSSTPIMRIKKNQEITMKRAEFVFSQCYLVCNFQLFRLLPVTHSHLVICSSKLHQALNYSLQLLRVSDSKVIRGFALLIYSHSTVYVTVTITHGVSLLDKRSAFQFPRNYPSVNGLRIFIIMFTRTSY
jgi:hypothetical protein